MPDLMGRQNNGTELAILRRIEAKVDHLSATVGELVKALADEDDQLQAEQTLDGQQGGQERDQSQSL